MILRTLRKIVNRIVPARRKFAKRLSKLLGFTPANLAIYKLAFKHSSMSPEAHTSNERLEYLGDAVLDTIISDYLFKKYPLKGEGFLTEMRSKIVKRKKLGEIGGNLHLEEFLDYDHSYVKVNSTILGNALEALIGAVFIDAGYEKTNDFIYYKIIKPYINLDDLLSGDINYKSRLFEWSQKYNHVLEFKQLSETMKGNHRVFKMGAYINGKCMGQGQGRSKKDAQREAAQRAYDFLKVGEDAVSSALQ